MALVTCSFCGRQISDAAPSCIHCGGPRGAHTSAAPARSSSLGVVAVVAAVVLGGVFVIGILAAIAIPKFASVSRAAKEAEAPPALEQLLLEEESYRDRAGAYTADLARLREQGWTPTRLRYYRLSVSEASDTGLCIEATPVGTEQLAPQSMDEAGTHYLAAGCVDDGPGAPVTME